MGDAVQEPDHGRRSPATPLPSGPVSVRFPHALPEYLHSYSGLTSGVGTLTKEVWG
jgi:hypothetical protein